MGLFRQAAPPPFKTAARENSVTMVSPLRKLAFAMGGAAPGFLISGGLFHSPTTAFVGGALLLGAGLLTAATHPPGNGNRYVSYRSPRC